MSTFVNLLEIVYPVGSIYCSTSSMSPAATFGGTWAQIKDAFLAGKGTSYITGNLGSLNGDKYIKFKQMPIHSHEINISGVNTSTAPYYMNTVSENGYKWSNSVAGGNGSFYNLMKDFQGVNSYKDHQATASELDILGTQNCAQTCMAVGGGKISLLTIIQSIFGAEPRSGLPRKGDEPLSLERRWA